MTTRMPLLTGIGTSRFTLPAPRTGRWHAMALSTSTVRMQIVSPMSGDGWGIEVQGPQNEDCGKREGWITDPDGNLVRFGSPIR